VVDTLLFVDALPLKEPPLFVVLVELLGEVVEVLGAVVLVLGLLNEPLLVLVLVEGRLTLELGVEKEPLLVDVLGALTLERPPPLNPPPPLAIAIGAKARVKAIVNAAIFLNILHSPLFEL
jgi:hypothetical protein